VEIDLTSDQEFFQETTRKFLEAECPIVAVRALRDSAEGFDRDYWRQGAELGWTSLLVSEEAGGGSISGRGLVDLTLVAHEFGRHASPGPLLATNVVAAALSRGGTAEQQADVLAGILAGEVVASWAWAGARPDDKLGHTGVTATRTGDGWTLTGKALPVEAGAQADQLLVTAADGDGLTQFLLPTATAGIAVKQLNGIDLTRRYASVTFDGVVAPASSVVGTAGAAAEDVERQLQLALIIQTAETVGAMELALEMTIEWSFDRYSFGRPLASYQELKHRFADMKTWLEASHAIATKATRAVQQEDDDAAKLVSVAASYVGDVSVELMQDCVQIHGGIGVTFDHDLHLYLRRATQNRVLHGDPGEHRERITSILEATEAAA
jgi:alkylation response protein AidB-like acyl-CoA dehydrogenase